jgi:peptide/nickel transport system permease protein
VQPRQFGGRVSLIVGLSVAARHADRSSIGLIGGYLRTVDKVVMRVMDGRIHSGDHACHRADCVVQGEILIVIIAVTLPKCRGSKPGAAAAIASSPIRGSDGDRHERRHHVPSAAQRAAAADRASHLHLRLGGADEPPLSFLGAGTPPEIPSWGNIMAEARPYFQLAVDGAPARLFLAVTAGASTGRRRLRDMLDPQLARRA